jgi:hypothetical protein
MIDMRVNQWVATDGTPAILRSPHPLILVGAEVVLFEKVDRPALSEMVWILGTFLAMHPLTESFYLGVHRLLSALGEPSSVLDASFALGDIPANTVMVSSCWAVLQSHPSTPTSQSP